MVAMQAHGHKNLPEELFLGLPALGATVKTNDLPKWGLPKFEIIQEAEISKTRTFRLTDPHLELAVS